MLTRFAPSPSGYLHLGNIRTALFNWLHATRAGGRMLLRIEDTDQARTSEHHVQAIIEDLNWLGIPPAAEPVRQSQRSHIYDQQFETLQKQHAIYPCFCTAEQLAAERDAQIAAGQPPRYGEHCANIPPADATRRISAGEPAAWRFRVLPNETIEVDDWVRGQTTFQTNDLAHFIIRRTNGDYSFLFVNAVDDALMQITDVLRGEDHVANTPRQHLLLDALNLPKPRYGHISLMVGQGGKPLSKRDGLTPIREWRQNGYLPNALTNYLARVGHSYIGDDNATAELDQLLPLSDLAKHFTPTALSRAPSKYDSAQLLRRQKEAVLQLSDQEFQNWIGKERLRNITDPAAFCTLIKENTTLPSDADDWRSIMQDPEPQTVTEEAKATQTTAGADFYKAAAAIATETPSQNWQEFTHAVAAATGKKGKQLYPPLRAALTGRTDGPNMQAIYHQLTNEQRHTRLKTSIKTV